jgi:hypothetical protein
MKIVKLIVINRSHLLVKLEYIFFVKSDIKELKLCEDFLTKSIEYVKIS